MGIAALHSLLNDKMATESKLGSARVEFLVTSKKYEPFVECGDLYTLPVYAVPGCGYTLANLLAERQGITKAGQLYDVFMQQRHFFSGFIADIFGPRIGGGHEAFYAEAIIRAFEDWEKRWR